ncbi:hypothetical protein DSCO28_73730 (plasmid) [Desulfosarcina ovata subsp. sediminis]|uniref:Uncharacterized protein n=1 Tax=Desulfosarcina ovata subsp. sediminis TaxID=885957 RepID=A0A5K8A2T7_9BACT|nr:hypothetical protein [Desulfosarcina ovata]BBO86807.1 hypothetical protein DSCO28_73730 [Desulfosarcina ovata subsp. sediminis]
MATQTKLMVKRRIKIYQVALSQKKKQIRKLEGIDTPKSYVEKAEIQKEIDELEIKINESIEKLENTKYAYKPDLFNG